MELIGRVVIVPGASSAIGEAAARRLAGGRSCGCGRRRPKCVMRRRAIVANIAGMDPRSAWMRSDRRRACVPGDY